MAKANGPPLALGEIIDSHRADARSVARCSKRLAENGGCWISDASTKTSQVIKTDQSCIPQSNLRCASAFEVLRKQGLLTGLRFLRARLEPVFLAIYQIVEFLDELHESVVVLLILNLCAKPVHLLTFFRSHQAPGINGCVAFFSASLRT